MLANLTIAVLLVTSGVAKLRAPQETRDAFVALRLPKRLADSPAPAALPWGELALALALVFGTGWVLILATAAAVVLFVAYTVVVVRALGFDQPVRCSCFGALGSGPIGRATVVRNVILVILAGVGLVAALAGQSSYGLVGTDWLWVAVAALAAAAVALSLGGSSPAPVPGSWTGRASVMDESGAPRSLRSLAAETKGAVLVFVQPGCHACERLANRLAGATGPTRDLIVAKSVDGGGDDAWSALGPVYADFGYNIAHALGLPATPAAIGLDARGTAVGDMAVGETQVWELITGDVPQAPAPTPAVEEPAPQPAPAPEVGPDSEHDDPEHDDPEDDELEDYERLPIPDGVLIRTDGQAVTPRELAAGRAQLLVGINCLCSESRRALETAGLWEDRLELLDVRVVVPFKISDGAVPADQEERTLYDHHGLVSSLLGLHGQASAVLLGADGLLAGGPVHGFEQIEQFVGDIAEQLGQ